MVEEVAGEYLCTECRTDFEIRSSDIKTAYTGWRAVCPTCGAEEYVERQGSDDGGFMDDVGSLFE